MTLGMCGLNGTAACIDRKHDGKRFCRRNNHHKVYRVCSKLKEGWENLMWRPALSVLACTAIARSVERMKVVK